MNENVPGAKYVIGIDLGGTFVKFVYARSDGEILMTDKIPTRVSHGSDAILGDIAKKIGEIIDKNGHGRENIIGCGIGCPGTVDSDFRKVIFAPNLKWNDVDVKAKLEELAGLSVYIDNDANLAALGEYWRGAGRGVRDFICVTLGTGIGGGIVVNGKLLRGVNNNAAEIGHMTIDFNGAQCGCSNYGCWEKYASATALVARVLNFLSINKNQRSKIPSIIFELCSNDLSKLNCELILEAARRGDPMAKSAVNQQIEFTAIGLINLIYIFNPNKIILSGGLSAAFEDLIKPVIDTVFKKAPKVSLRDFEIKVSNLGNDAGSMGAIFLVLNEKNILEM
jgi:glucokinase